MSIMTAKKSQGVAAAAGPVFRSMATSDKGAGAVTWTAVPLPAGVQDGDRLIAVLITSSAAVVLTVPSGWAHVTGSPVASSGGDAQTHVLTRVASSEPASFDITWGGTAFGCAALLAYRLAGALGGSVGAGFSATATPTAPSLTPAVDNCMVLAIYGCDQAAGGVTWTPPTGYTERVDVQDTSAFTSLHVAEKLQTTAIAAAPQATVSTADEGSAFTVALRPA